MGKKKGLAVGIALAAGVGAAVAAKNYKKTEIKIPRKYICIFSSDGTAGDFCLERV